MVWGSPVEIERRRRIKLSVAAYAYEFEDHSLMTDEEFDALSRAIDVNVVTGNLLLDTFFLTEFSPDTGMWIHNHPELDKLKSLYYRHYRDKANAS